MMAVLIMLVGVGLMLAGSFLMLRFLGEFSELIKRFNELYQGEVHSLNSELREELNELNYSYYDILDKQDDRISKLEKLTTEFISSNAPPFRVIDDGVSREPDAVRLIDSKIEELPEEGGVIVGQGSSDVDLIRRLYEEGTSVEDIAKELGLGLSYVDLILSLYVKKGEERV